MKLEDRILSYLDGTLDESERAELLHTLSVSPEKRAILEEHLRLRDLTAFGNKPFAVPEAAERALANRITAIGREMPHLVEDDNTMAGWLASAANWFSKSLSLPSVRVASTAVAVGALIWFGLYRPSENASNAVQQRLAANNGAAAFPSSAGNPVADQSSSNLNSSIDAQEVLTQPSAMSPIHPRTNDQPSGIAASTGSEHAVQAAHHVARNNEDSENAEDINVASLSQSSTSHASINHGAEVKSNHGSSHSLIASNQSDQNDAYVDALNVGEIPTITIATVPHSTSGDLADASAPSAERSGYTRLRFEDEDHSEPHGLFTAWAGFGLQQSFGVVFGNNPITPSALTAPAFGINYLLSDRLSLGIESGEGTYSRFGSTIDVSPIAGEPHVYRVQYNATVMAQSARWVRATLGITAFSFDKLRFSANAGFGSVFANGPSPMLSASAIGTYELTDEIGLNAQVSYSASWLHPSASPDWRDQIPAGGSAVGIVSDPVRAATLLTPALDVFVGLRYAF